MLFTLLLALTVLTVAAPLQKPALSTADISILQLAQYLENLEFALYTAGCNNFSVTEYNAEGFDNAFHAGVCLTAQQEAIHAAAIGAILEANGVPTVSPCQYTFPFYDPISFVLLANQVTSVGIGAYLGASQVLTDNTILEEASNSILTVEARHDAFLRGGLFDTNPFPAAFDTAISATWAFNLAQPFIVSCPSQLPTTPLPTLNLTTSQESVPLLIPAGTALGFSWEPSTFLTTVDPSAALYIAMVNQNVSAPVFEQVTVTGTSNGMSTGTVPLPKGVAGAVFACLTTFSGGLTLDDLSSYGTLAGPVEITVS